MDGKILGDGPNGTGSLAHAGPRLLHQRGRLDQISRVGILAKLT